MSSVMPGPLRAPSPTGGGGGCLTGGAIPYWPGMDGIEGTGGAVASKFVGRLSFVEYLLFTKSAVCK